MEKVSEEVKKAIINDTLWRGKKDRVFAFFLFIHNLHSIGFVMNCKIIYHPATHSGMPKHPHNNTAFHTKNTSLTNTAETHTTHTDSVGMATYWCMSVISAWAGVRAYLIGLSRTPCGPYELHDGHKNSNDQTTDQDYKYPTNILHTQTYWTKEKC